MTVCYATKYLNRGDFVSFLDIMKEIDTVPILVGENRVQDAEKKFKFIRDNYPDKLSFFNPVLIGSLQSNKINKALTLFSEIHSIDSLALAGKLNEKVTNPVGLSIFLEVNVSGEESKHGFSPEQLEQSFDLLKSLKFLKIKGLMTMAPHTENPDEIRQVFKKLRELADHYGLKTSMGMSSDWRIAVEEGADIIRIGGRIFS